MKTHLTLSLLLTLMMGSALAQSVTNDFSVTGGSIADGNPTGTAFSGAVSNVLGNIESITVGLDMAGGYNGDLYAYLVAPNNTMVVLLNQPGTDEFGAPGAGFDNFTLDDLAISSIQTAMESAGVPFSGSYQAAGTLADFSGKSANGLWTLFIADLASGGGTSTLNGWSLQITAVPEPSPAAMGMFGAIFTIVVFQYRRLK